jgi:DNA-binding MarR family transcriptional regulator
MSRLVDDLERLGLVERVAQPGDRRVNLVRVRKAGRTLLEEGRRKRLARLIALLAATNPAERRALHSAALTLMRLTDSGLVSRAGTARSPASGKVGRQRRLTGPHRRKD